MPLLVYCLSPGCGCLGARTFQLRGVMRTWMHRLFI